MGTTNSWNNQKKNQQPYQRGYQNQRQQPHQTPYLNQHQNQHQESYQTLYQQQQDRQQSQQRNQMLREQVHRSKQIRQSSQFLWNDQQQYPGNYASDIQTQDLQVDQEENQENFADEPTMEAISTVTWDDWGKEEEACMVDAIFLLEEGRRLKKKKEQGKHSPFPLEGLIE